MSKGKRLFRVIRGMVNFFYPQTEFIDFEKTSEPVIYVGNHAQMHGPIICELYMPDSCYTWCAGQMMHLKDVPEYAYEDFWSEKPALIKPFFKALSYIIAPFSVAIFNNARTVAVYHDTRILSTFRETVNKLSEGKSIVIFPEHNERYNNVVYDFQNKFVDVARMYHRKTGKELKFVPVYIAPRLKKAYFGKAVTFSPEADIESERQRICRHLMGKITEMATSLPPHTVVPYRNMPKKKYPTNVAEVKEIEKTRC